MQLVPYGDRLIVRAIPDDDISQGGVIIPSTAKEKPQRGVVLAVGQGPLLKNGSFRALEMQINDEVIFGRYGGTEIKLDGEELLFLREADVLVCLKND